MTGRRNSFDDAWFRLTIGLIVAAAIFAIVDSCGIHHSTAKGAEVGKSPRGHLYLGPDDAELKRQILDEADHLFPSPVYFSVNIQAENSCRFVPNYSGGRPNVVLFCPREDMLRMLRWARQYQESLK